MIWGIQETVPAFPCYINKLICIHSTIQASLMSDSDGCLVDRCISNCILFRHIVFVLKAVFHSKPQGFAPR